MTRAEAHAVLERERLAIDPSNLASPIMQLKAELVDALLTVGVRPAEMSAITRQDAVQMAVLTCTEGARFDLGVSWLQVLKRHGLDMDALGNANYTALMMGAQFCPPETVSFLLAEGADHGRQSAQSFTPLSLALYTGGDDTARVLIDAGARVSTEAKQAIGEYQQVPGMRALLEEATLR
ncbi:MAG: ankyrin repeat domain-containing protein [Aquimonas sp.]|nr:ankyrin repeat domain-containing protein [Aquimonas sp.]